ncbi:undecaprenyl-diphosphate phosphatase [Paenibacillus sp. J2TS4]|uniref:undecaprenyl-diphosphate phosphatase n=1 Tax=Paenibacillus sp. J2TS4 TaxID=2807194 RepID=UPI001B2B06A4|nr:undecaprenyl-diphosphate phosphatase [Paenibacillus sp. J2TS4]GIP33676.1 undecaprenyl-diphosphatase 3 [Paenibacillus sp. J2TS4]
MLELWKAIIVGIVEGLTEFLPVSSTGHMILVGHLIDFRGDKADTFEIAIQLGAILSVVVLYWKRVLRLFGIQDRSERLQPGPRLNLLHILIGIVPAMGFGFLAHKYIKLLFMPETVVIGLIMGGIFMIIAEKQSPPVAAETMDGITYKQSLYIGVAQCLSLWPGFSRSGATIAAGMLAGTSRGAAADYTFLMAIPIMTAATGYDLLKNYSLFSTEDLLPFIVGFLVSFVVALLAVATFIKLVSRLKLTYFSYYRFVLAAIVILYMAIGGFSY